MDLTHLRYFHVTAAAGSMSAAARKLGISQPSLTVAIRQLEKHLGTTLFLRERNGVRLTSTGELLLRHATNVLALIEHAEQDVRGLESDEVGSFVLGCHESLGAYFLPGFMSSFLREAPRIELTLCVGLLPRRVAAYGQEGRLRRLHPTLPFFPDVISLVYRADGHRTRAALRLKDALIRYGRGLGASAS